MGKTGGERVPLTVTDYLYLVGFAVLALTFWFVMVWNLIRWIKE